MGDSQSNTRTDLQAEEAAPASVHEMVHGEAAGNGFHPQQFALQPSSSLDEAGRLRSTEDMHLDSVDSGTEHELVSRSSIDVDELVRRTSVQLSGAESPTVRCAGLLSISSGVRARAVEVLGAAEQCGLAAVAPSFSLCECGDSFKGSEGGQFGNCCSLPAAAVLDVAGTQSGCTGHCQQLARGGPQELVSRQKRSPPRMGLKAVRGCSPPKIALEGQRCGKQVDRHAPGQAHVCLRTAMMRQSACTGMRAVPYTAS